MVLKRGRAHSSDFSWRHLRKDAFVVLGGAPLDTEVLIFLINVFMFFFFLLKLLTTTPTQAKYWYVISMFISQFIFVEQKVVLRIIVVLLSDGVRRHNIELLAVELRIIQSKSLLGVFAVR